LKFWLLLVAVAVVQMEVVLAAAVVAQVVL
jgi:hypothetical protein